MREAKDVEGNNRQAIVFELVPNTEVEVGSKEGDQTLPTPTKSLASLRKDAYAASESAQGGVRDAKRTAGSGGRRNTLS